MKFFDVTLPISEDLIVYPGDPAIVIERLSEADPREGTYGLTCYSFGSHSGTHIDAPAHFLGGDQTVDQIPLELLVGRARVVEVTAPCIDETVLQEFDFTADVRVLFKTRNSYLWNQNRFNEVFVHITPGAARALVNAGIKLVGIDYLSVEKFGAAKPETHLTLLNAGTIIIEGLDLREVEPGDYEMICLPLKVRGGEGAPARVVLRQ